MGVMKQRAHENVRPRNAGCNGVAKGACAGGWYAICLLQPLVWPHGADGVALYKHIAVCQNFDRPKCVAIRPNKALTPFNEALLVPDETTDFDHVALHVVVEDFKGLLNGD